MPEGYRNLPQVKFWALAQDNVAVALSSLEADDEVTLDDEGKLRINGAARNEWVCTEFEV